MSPCRRAHLSIPKASERPWLASVGRQICRSPSSFFEPLCICISKVTTSEILEISSRHTCLGKTNRCCRYCCGVKPSSLLASIVFNPSSLRGYVLTQSHALSECLHTNGTLSSHVYLTLTPRSPLHLYEVRAQRHSSQVSYPKIWVLGGAKAAGGPA